MASDAAAIANGGERLAGRPEGRRLLALPGVVSVLLALFSAIGSFVILVGLTPIQPTASVTLALIILNAGFILLLTGLIIREIHRILTARRHGRAAARLHVRIVTLFSVAAGVPAIVVAIAAALTLNIGLRWDYERTPAFLDYVHKTAYVNAVSPANYPNLINADYDIADYISTGSERKAFKGAWQPRLAPATTRRCNAPAA